MNMIELQIFNFNQNTKNLSVYQFTIKQKMGMMNFEMDKNYKIQADTRKHLYASKVFFDPDSSLILKLKNFGDGQFQNKKISWLPHHVFGIVKKEEYYGITK